MGEHEERTEDDVALPEDRVEDLEPGDEDADDVGGGAPPGGDMGWNVGANKKL